MQRAGSVPVPKAGCGLGQPDSVAPPRAMGDAGGQRAETEQRSKRDDERQRNGRPQRQEQERHERVAFSSIARCCWSAPLIACEWVLMGLMLATGDGGRQC